MANGSIQLANFKRNRKTPAPQSFVAFCSLYFFGIQEVLWVGYYINFCVLKLFIHLFNKILQYFITIFHCLFFYKFGHIEAGMVRSEEHTSELQSRENLVCR